MSDPKDKQNQVQGDTISTDESNESPSYMSNILGPTFLAALEDQAPQEYLESASLE